MLAGYFPRANAQSAPGKATSGRCKRSTGTAGIPIPRNWKAENEINAFLSIGFKEPCLSVFDPGQRAKKVQEPAAKESISSANRAFQLGENGVDGQPPDH